jgi:hypothetical protein
MICCFLLLEISAIRHHLKKPAIRRHSRARGNPAMERRRPACMLKVLFIITSSGFPHSRE